MNFEKAYFKDVPIESWLYLNDEDQKVKTYKKKCVETAINISTKEIKEFFPMDEVLIKKEPKFVLNH
jgi:hypothetical protein